MALSPTLGDMTTAPLAPAPPPPPPGPGVHPPFPAPPTEGRNRRIGTSLGLAGGALVLACGGGVAAAVGLVTVTSRALNEQVHVVVRDYLDDVRAKRYNEAYDEQCQQAKDRESRAEFAGRVAEEDPIASYRIGDISLTSLNQSVPVDVTYADGGTGQLYVSLGQNPQTGRYQVCGVE